MTFSDCYDEIDSIRDKITGRSKKEQLEIALEILEDVAEDALIYAEQEIERQNPGMPLVVVPELTEDYPDFSIDYEQLTSLTWAVKCYVMQLQEFVWALERFTDIFKKYNKIQSTKFQT